MFIKWSSRVNVHVLLLLKLLDMKSIFLYLLIAVEFVFLPSWAVAAEVDTVTVYSQSMRKNTRCVVIVPDSGSFMRLPVLYLLHGFGGDHRSWLKVKSDLPEWADRLGLIIVCPNGERTWYLDSPVDSTVRMETYINKELIPYIDNHYATIASRDGRAIAGLSMGGHGSLHLAMRNPDVFSTVCSTSGSVNLLKKTFTYKYRELILGNEQENHVNWSQHSIMTLAGSISPGKLNMWIDCGTEDEWLEENRKLHGILLDRNVPHDYSERPGAHDAAYWNNSIDYILLFVAKHIAIK